jgi:pilus assembly protein CpaF
MALPNANSGGKPFIPASRQQQKAVDQANPLFDDDDDEKVLVSGVVDTLKVYKTTDDPIQELLEAKYEQLRKQYPNGGWKSFQFITAEILMQAPANWFDKYEDALKEGTNWTQSQLAIREKSEAIAAAQAEPTNDELKDAAFRAIYTILTEFLNKHAFRGIDRIVLVSMVTSEVIGFSRIDPIWRDRTVDEIIINGPKDIQVEIRGQLRRVPACKFRDADHVLMMLERVFSSINKTLSKNTPLIKGRLHDQSRIFAVHPTVAPQGPNVAIRRHPDKYWTPKDLVDLGSFDSEVGKFIGNLIYNGCSFVVIGGTSTGKTSFLNAMTGFYREDVRLITLEDNLEMKPNPRKMLAAAMETKPGNVENNNAGVTMRELVKGTLQMRPDGLIIGEVTDGAAADLVQALNTGHFGASTIHANSEFDGIYRIASLIQQGGELSQAQTLPLIAAAFDFIVLLEHFPLDGSRRVSSISEINPYVTSKPGVEPTLGVKQLFKFVNDGVVQSPDHEGVARDKIIGHWEKTGELSETRRERRHLDLGVELEWDQLMNISSIPEPLLKQEIKR